MRNYEAVVAGYLCLDIIPSIHTGAEDGGFEFVPGKLEEIGTTSFAPGGAVANTGLAMNKLGIRTALSGLTGNDSFGIALKDILEKSCGDKDMLRLIKTAPDLSTAHTFILNPPGQDRMFLVHSGANAEYSSKDINAADMEGAKLLHYGYPPLLPASFPGNGADTLKMFKTAKAKGLCTSLDTCVPDPAKEAGKIDWRAWLENVLPAVDIFLPSLEELLFITRGEFSEDLSGNNRRVDTATLYSLSGELLDMGGAVIVIKMGANGIYVRTSSDRNRIAAANISNVNEWVGRELIAPCRKVNVKGTCGAGDCTIGGFLAGILKGRSLPECASIACASGSCCVEQPDAFSGLLDFNSLHERIKSGWEIEKDQLGPDWELCADNLYRRKK
jgi:sugar/nucleoside kinase (ribokinase family)